MADPVKFLLVDDVEENLVALSALLQRDGLELFTAPSGNDALEHVLEHDFALAMLDVQMPVMNGFELAELMRGAARSRHVPIIFVTAGVREPNRVFKGYESGAVDFLFKPIDPHVLRHKANVFFDLYRQRQQLAEQIAERERLLCQLSETLRLNEMFSAALGHDLRNPLGAIMNSAALLAQRDDDAAGQAAVAQRILSSGNRMARMIDQLLDLGRARVGSGIPLGPVPFNLRSLADLVVSDHLSADPGRAIDLEAVGDLHGTWDESRLAQVLSNLIGNALQHGRKSYPVTVRLDGRESDAVKISVSNDGVVDPEQLPHLFEPFRSGREQTRRSEGLGLGLYIVDQVVKAHGGTIAVRSTDEDGTDFEVRLPRTAVRA